MTVLDDATAAIATLSDASASVDAKKATLDAVAKCFDDDESPSSIVSKDLALASTSKDLALAVARLAAGDKKRDPENVVADLAIGVMKKMAQKTHECVVNAALVPACLEALDPKEKWQTQVAAAEALATACKTSSNIIASNLTTILPVVASMVNDAKQQVADATRQCLEDLCRTIDNRDVEPFIPAMVEATIDHEKSDECVQKLASTTFVQTVTAAPLALISPILLLGFRSRATATKRMSAVIVNNMSKLVEDPEDAAPFLPNLLPAVTKASEQVSDPEARAVCGKACEQLQSIEAKLNDASFKSKRAVFDDVKKQTDAKLGAHFDVNDKTVSDFYATVACALVNAKAQDYDFEEALGKSFPVDDIRALHATLEQMYGDVEDEEDDDDTADVLADCQFTLAYGSKVLLHNTKLKLKRGHKYALLGGNDSGKTSLMRAIANEQVEGFPPASELRTVFVEADIIGELSDLPCVDYILADPRIKDAGITEETVEKMLLNVGFGEMQNGARNLVTFLSGGWRMKLALARAMCLNADILLMDEPTNHLDVMNVKWVEEYLKSLTDVTAVLVSHDTGFVDRVCNNIISIESLKLKQFRGTLTEFVEKNPKARSFFELKSSSGFVMRFPQPGFIDGVKSKGKPLMKMANCTYTYPVNEVPTVKDVTVQVSLASRVACVGPNGVGKSTMIKLLTGEIVPQEGTVWKHPNARVAYVAQHAFHHIEQHLEKTPNEYIRWRYQHGDDKEALVKDTMVLTEEEKERCKQPVKIDIGKDEKGNQMTLKMAIEKLTGGRKQVKKEYEYEVQFVGRDYNSNRYIQATKLAKWGFEKHMKVVDEKVAARAGAMHTPLTTANVEKHLEDVGLDKEFGTHTRMSALSGGQKVKVVIAASMWNCPHIVILDEPTNYLDRDSLGALAGAIQVYEGGVVMITHNNEFCSALCPETWLMEKADDGIARCNCKGDAEWMAKASKKEVTSAAALDEFTDALGNVVKVKKKVDKNSKEAKKKAKLRAKRRARGEVVTDTDEEEWEGFGEE